ncbi:glycosyltransferase family 4 protein [Salinirussus salinus]|uniref:glycosyltransferase family 4 protein n=1 Tax=Salinirussus salinus TaxID=1198300 RepID=UPI001358A38C|nr:glycosyltransferase family 4 protein [Salinirussus salinus]
MNTDNDRQVERVLLFTPKYPPSRGGAAVFYSNIVRTTDEQIRFFVVTKYEKGETIIQEEDNVTIYRLLPRTDLLPRYLRVVLEMFVLAIVCLYLVTTESIQIIHAHASSFSVLALSAVAAVSRVPLINDCRDEAFRPWLIKLGPTPVWFSCAPNIDSILIKNGIPERRIIRLPVVNPEYVSNYESTGRKGNDMLHLIHVGSIREEKGVFLLLDTLEHLHEQGVSARLTLIGDGPEMENLRRSCNERVIKECVTIAGRLDHRETLNHLAAADVLALLSESEGIPRVVLEAQEIGTPVVATSAGGIPEIIDDEKTGLLVSRTASSAAEAINCLFSDEELYETITTNAKQERQRTWDHAAEQLYEGYRRALD